MPKNQQRFDNPALIAEQGKNLATHHAYLSNPTKVVLKEIKAGDVIQFMYNGDERTVLVLNPDWKLQLHGLSLKAIDRKTLMTEIVSKADMYKSPMDFYTRVIKKDVIKKADAYRTYDLRKMGDMWRMDYDAGKHSIKEKITHVIEKVIDHFKKEPEELE